MIDLKDPAKPAFAGEYTVPDAATVVEYAAVVAAASLDINSFRRSIA